MCLFKIEMVESTWEQDSEKQKVLFEKVNREKVQPHVEMIEKHLIKNGTGYLVGQKVSLIQFSYFEYLL